MSHRPLDAAEANGARLHGLVVEEYLFLQKNVPLVRANQLEHWNVDQLLYVLTDNWNNGYIMIFSAIFSTARDFLITCSWLLHQ